ncbi:DUF1223 domain-containing protein [Derxia lacustris]|uniref:DUF1223 domain-containing protein n=1 Tax=Derxia lacustris TaxID=764842 RepID=UPI000A170D7B|nr:DUF1223 domain-containing protein [Derxia lacustris]
MNAVSLLHRSAALAIAGLATIAAPFAANAACVANSGATTTALVELYTSEGCSSCPPADRALGKLDAALAPGAAAIPIALHVDYWDSIGWKDPFAQAAFGARQSWRVGVLHQRTVWTPHFFVSGGELRDWREKLRDQVRQINATPARASVRLDARLAADGALNVDASAATTAGTHPALYVAVTESGLTSKVARGENGGATLHHDHVVRSLIGPIDFADGKAALSQRIKLPAEWNRDGLALVGFVEDAANGQVLQAATTGQCLRS